MIEKKIGKYISLRMGLVMSIIMSVVGSVMGIMEARSHAETGAQLPPFIVMLLPSLLVSLVIATILAVGIGFIVSMKKVNEGVEKATKAKGFGLHLIQAIVSDLIYTPFISLIMTFVSTALFAKVPSGAFVPAAIGSFLRSLPIEFVLALIAILIAEPILQKAAFKKYIPGFGQKIEGDDAICD